VFLGEFARGRDVLAQGIAFYDAPDAALHQEGSKIALREPKIALLAYLAYAEQMLGYADQALQHGYEALTIARELAHPFTLGWGHCWVARLHQLCRQAQVVQQLAETCIGLASKHGFTYWLTTATILWGWALAEQGQPEEGIAQIRQGITTWRSTGAELAWPDLLALQAEAHGRAGQTEAGLTVLTEGLAVVDKNGERFYEAELHRLKGELLLMQAEAMTPTRTEAVTCLHQALDIARRQQAKALEL